MIGGSRVGSASSKRARKRSSALKLSTSFPPSFFLSFPFSSFTSPLVRDYTRSGDLMQNGASRRTLKRGTEVVVVVARSFVAGVCCNAYTCTRTRVKNTRTRVHRMRAPFQIISFSLSRHLRVPHKAHFPSLESSALPPGPSLKENEIARDPSSFRDK